jgi:hypothetical protein
MYTGKVRLIAFLAGVFTFLSFATPNSDAQTSFVWTNGTGFWSGSNWTNDVDNSSPSAGGSIDYELLFWQRGRYAVHRKQ